MIGSVNTRVHQLCKMCALTFFILHFYFENVIIKNAYPRGLNRTTITDVFGDEGANRPDRHRLNLKNNLNTRANIEPKCVYEK